MVTRNPCHWKLHFNIYSPCSAEGDCQEKRRLGSAIIYMSYINKHKILVDMQISFFLDLCIIRCNDCFVFKLQSNLSIKTFPNTTLVVTPKFLLYKWLPSQADLLQTVYALLQLFTKITSVKEFKYILK